MTRSYSVYTAALMATILIFVVNALIPSFVNGFTPGLNFDFSNLIENIRSEELFHSRYEHSEYGRRLIVLGIQKWAYDIGIPYQLSFNLINLVANYCFFYFGFRLASIHFKALNPYLFMGFLALSFPVLFAYLPVIFTYDDTAQFALLTGFFLCLYKEKRTWAYILFFLACLSRETSLLFGIFLSVYFWVKEKNFRVVLLELIPYALICFFYFAILYSVKDADQLQVSKEFLFKERFYAFKNNFSDLNRILEISLYMSAVYLAPLIVVYRKQITSDGQALFKAFQFLFVVNLALCLVATIATEARFYTMTLIPIFPLLAPGLQSTWNQLKQRSNFSPQLLIAAILIAAGLISLYHPQVKRAYYVFAPYLFVYFSFCIYLFLLNYKRNKVLEK